MTSPNTPTPPSTGSLIRLPGSFLIAAGLFVAACLAAPASAESLIINGTFEIAGNDPSWPDGWLRPKTGEATWELEEGNHFVRLRSTEPSQTLLIHRLVHLPAGTKAVTLSVRARVSDLVPGSQPWFDARIMADFKNASGAKVKGAKSLVFRKNTEWVDRTASFLVPEGATTLEIMPSLTQVAAGTFDIDNLVLEAIDPATIPQATAK
ncbi:MAG: hypothetical protein K0R17_1832 [Rariglobus sp.]|jgi:hypothetical protein|nr:hypothetical protein [Rariglobus sp.]